MCDVIDCQQSSICPYVLEDVRHDHMKDSTNTVAESRLCLEIVEEEAQCTSFIMYNIL